jgi:hypothetical protein
MGGFAIDVENSPGNGYGRHGGVGPKITIYGSSRVTRRAGSLVVVAKFGLIAIYGSSRAAQRAGSPVVVAKFGLTTIYSLVSQA